MALLLVADKEFVFDSRPVPGSVLVYRHFYQTRSSFTTDSFYSRTQTKISRALPDGSIRVQHSSLGGYSLMMGKHRQKMKPQPLGPAMTFGPDGKLKGDPRPVIETEPMVRVISAVTAFKMPEGPVKIGDWYGRILSSNDGLGVNDCTTRYEVVRSEKWKGQDVLRIKFSYSEKHSATAFEGYWLIRIRDGVPVSLRASGTDVPYVLNLPTGDATIERDLILER